jgi:hypothetical protein
MCHEFQQAIPEDVLPPYYPWTCLDPCDGSEEIFGEGYTVSLDNDGDLYYDSYDADCQECTSVARVSGASLPDYPTLQEAYDNASHNGTILVNKKHTLEDLYQRNNNRRKNYDKRRYLHHPAWPPGYPVANRTL